MKTFLLLPLLTVLVSPLWAAEAPIVGSSSMKVEDTAVDVKATRREIIVLDEKITTLEGQIQSARTQSLNRSIVPGSRVNGASAAADAQVSAYELQMSALVAQRTQLEAELSNR